MIDPACRRVRVKAVMGTAISVDVRGGSDPDDALSAVFAWFREVDRRFSPYLSTSEVMRYARHEVADADLSPELAHVVRVCESVRHRSGGAFAAWRDGVFDPSAYVKGWSVQRAGELLRAAGHRTWSINAGGDVLVSTDPDGPAPWRIGVRHPFDPTALTTTVVARDLAVATSGTYERGTHITDPRSGRPADDVVSVTVCGPDLGLADAYSTAAFVMGAAGPAWVAAIHGYECSSIFSDGRVVATSGFPRTVHGVPVTTQRAAAAGATL